MIRHATATAAVVILAAACSHATERPPLLAYPQESLVGGVIEHDLRLAVQPILLSVEGGVVRTPAVAPRVVEGLIVAGNSGRPIRSAVVRVVGTNRGALTDSAGRFRLEQAPLHDVTLQIQSIGYTSARLRLDLSSDSGYSVVVPLIPARIELCAQPTAPMPSGFGSMKVFVVDARTGSAPRSVPVTVEVVDGDHREVHRAIATGDSLTIETGPWRTGVYDVTVTARSYAPWRVRGVVVGVDHCNSKVRTPVRVFLLPVGEVLGS